MINVCSLDDHPILRDGLKLVLSGNDDIQVTQEVSSGEELLEELDETKSNFLILDLSLPGMGGIEVLKKLRQRGVGLPILVLTMFNEKHYVTQAVQHGANGYLTKDRASKDLIRAIRTVSEGKFYIGSDLADQMIMSLKTGATVSPHEKLSAREFEVMCAIAKGLDLQGIADKLEINYKTVSTYKARIFQKLGFSSTAQVVRYALNSHLVE